MYWKVRDNVETVRDRLSETSYVYYLVVFCQLVLNQGDSLARVGEVCQRLQLCKSFESEIDIQIENWIWIWIWKLKIDIHFETEFDFEIEFSNS